MLRAASIFNGKKPYILNNELLSLAKIFVNDSSTEILTIEQH